MKAVQLLLIFASVLPSTCKARPNDPQPVKWYNISLETDPRERWSQVLEDFRIYVPDILNMINQMVPKELQPFANQIGTDLEKLVPSPFNQEILAVATYWGLDAGIVLLLNIVYDFTAFCTSIVAQDSNGVIWHARNLDYPLSDLLRNLTINVNFQRQNNTVYTAVTYAGYVGIATGQRPHNFTITIDQRGRDAAKPDPLYLWIFNVLITVLDKSASFVTFLIRQTLEECKTFAQAVDKLSFTVIHAPSYFIVGGSKIGEGVIITRDRIAALNRYYLDPEQGRWYVLETNFDHWLPEPILDNNRSATGEHEMNKLGQDHINVTTLYNVLSTPQVLNRGTTYSVVMCASQPDIFTSWVRWPPAV